MPGFLADDMKANHLLLLGLSKDIPDDCIYDMGIRLGFKIAEIQRFRKMNSGNVSTEGTLTMLHSWYEKTPQSERNRELQSSLDRSGLAGLVEKYLVSRRRSSSEQSTRESLGPRS